MEAGPLTSELFYWAVTDRSTGSSDGLAGLRAGVQHQLPGSGGRRRRRLARAEWRRWRRWRARRHAETAGTFVAGLSARSPSWMPRRLDGRQRRFIARVSEKRWRSCLRGGADPAAWDETVSMVSGGEVTGSWSRRGATGAGSWRRLSSGVFTAQERQAAAALERAVEEGVPHMWLKAPGRDKYQSEELLTDDALARSVSVGAFVRYDHEGTARIGRVERSLGTDFLVRSISGGERSRQRVGTLTQLTHNYLDFSDVAGLLPDGDVTGGAIDAYGAILERESRGRVVFATSYASVLATRADCAWLRALAQRTVGAEGVVIPWHLPGHWAYAVLKLDSVDAWLYDSLDTRGGVASGPVARSIRRVMHQLRDMRAERHVHVKLLRGPAQHQGQTRDCGVHVLAGMRKWAQDGGGVAWRIRATDYRLHVLLELMQGSTSGGASFRGKCRTQPRPGARERARRRHRESARSGARRRGRQASGTSGRRTVQGERPTLRGLRAGTGGTTSASRQETGSLGASQGRRRQSGVASSGGQLDRPTSVREGEARADGHLGSGAGAERARSRLVDRVAVWRRLCGQRSKPRKKRSKRARRDSRRRKTSARKDAAAEAAARQRPRADAKALPGGFAGVTRIAGEFVGADVLFSASDTPRDRTVRGLTWNAGGGLRDARYDFFLNYVTAQEDTRGLRLGYDFCAVQEPGTSWRDRGDCWLWETRLQQRPTSEGDTTATRCSRSGGSAGTTDVRRVARNSGWRARATGQVVLMWRREWEDRRRGAVRVSADGRTIGVHFSTKLGRIGVLAHYGVASPRHVDVEEGVGDGVNAANCQEQMFGILDEMAQKCVMVMLLGDTNTQRRCDRLDTASPVGAAPDASEVLWERMMGRGSFVDPMAVGGVRDVWTRTATCSTASGRQCRRTRPDWALASADWDRWQIVRAGVHVGEPFFELSDHRPVGLEMRALRQGIGLRRGGRVLPSGHFDSTNATEEQMSLWRSRVADMDLVAPTGDNWEAGGRRAYDKLISALCEAGAEIFAGSVVKRSGRPFWDKQAGRQLREMSVLRKLRRDLRRLRGAAPDQAQRARARLVKKARRHRNFPADVLLPLDSSVMGELEKGIAARKKSLRFRARCKRMTARQAIDELRTTGQMGKLVSRVLLRKSSGRDPFAALVMGKAGEPVVTGEPAILKQAAAAMASDWFTSIRNPARYSLVWDPAVTRNDAEAVLVEMRAREGWRCWDSDPMTQLARRAIATRPGEESGSGLEVLTHADVVWLRSRPDVRRVERHSSPYMVCAVSRVDEEELMSAIRSVADPADSCSMERIGGVWRSAEGLRVAFWLSSGQRSRLAALQRVVLMVIPLPPMAFVQVDESSVDALPPQVRAVWGLSGAETSGDPAVGDEGKARRKRRLFERLMQPQSFSDIYDRAWRRVNGKAVPGSDFLTKRLMDDAKVHAVMKGYLRLGIMRQDLSPDLTVSVLKWLPKDAKKSSYINMLSRAPPNKRPIGLNTLVSKVFEQILHIIQGQLNSEEEVVDEFMFAWHRGRSAFSAALIAILAAEDAMRRGAEMHVLNLDSYHWFDTVHQTTSIMVERSLGYPHELSYAKAAIRAGALWIRTEAGRAGPVFPEQGLGQGRVEAPSDSNRYDAAVLRALGLLGPYVLHAGGRYELRLAALHYADDTQKYSSTLRGLRDGASDSFVIHSHRGGAYTARKGTQGSVNASTVDIGDVWDPNRGGVCRIPVVESGRAQRYLGFYYDLRGESEEGARRLLAQCSKEIQAMGRRAVGWASMRYVLRSVLGGRVRYSSTLTRGMRHAMRKLDRSIASAALRKLGEKSTSSPQFLFYDGSVGGGLASMSEIRDVSLVKQAVAVLRAGRVESKALMGAMRAYARSRGTRWAWMRVVPEDGLHDMDDDVPSRVHASLSAARLIVAPTQEETRWGAADFDGRLDRAPDGGRWTDWLLMDILPGDVVKRVWRWCRDNAVRWLGQMMADDGRAIMSDRRWLQLHKGGRGEARWLWEATSTLLSARPLLRVSPVRAVRRWAGQTLPVGQLALMDASDDVGDGGPQVDRFALVQGVSVAGTVGAHWSRGSCGWNVGGCERCAMGECTADRHAPSAPRWDEDSNCFVLTVRRLSVWPAEDGSGRLTQIFAPEGGELVDISLPALLYPVQPRIMQHHGEVEADGLVPVVPCLGYDEWVTEGTTLWPGRPITMEQWRTTRQERVAHAADGRDDGATWACELCGRGEKWLGRRAGTCHPACSSYHRRWRQHYRGNRRLAVDGGGKLPVMAASLPGQPEGRKVYATDGSAKSTLVGGVEVVEAGCAVVLDGEEGATLGVKIVGRPQEISISYYAELVGLIFLHLVALDDAEHVWVGDNESVVDFYKQITVQGWTFTPSDLEQRPGRTLLRWLIQLVEDRQHPFKAYHQVSHLAEDTASQRARDYRVLLGRADVAAEVARSSEVYIFNMSGTHPGVDEHAVYEADTGWRVDTPLAPVVAARLQSARLQRWSQLQVQGAFLRTPGIRIKAMGWKGRSAQVMRSRVFASKLLRQTLATGVERSKYTVESRVRCTACEFGWQGGDKGDYVEVLREAREGEHYWAPAELADMASAAEEVVAVAVAGQEITVAKSAVRDGRWSLHDASHVLGVACHVQQRGLVDMLLDARRKHLVMLSTMVAAVVAGEDFEPLPGLQPYGRAVAWSLRRAGWDLRCAEVQAVQDDIQVYVARRVSQVVEADQGEWLGRQEQALLLHMMATNQVSSWLHLAMVRQLAEWLGSRPAVSKRGAADVERLVRRVGWHAADISRLVDEAAEEAYSGLDRRLVTAASGADTGLAALQDWLESCPDNGSDSFSCREYAEWRSAMRCAELRTLKLAKPPDEQPDGEDVVADSKPCSGSAGWRRRLMAEVGTVICRRALGNVQQGRLGDLAEMEAAGWRRATEKRHRGKKHRLPGGRLERKQHTAVVGWELRGVRVSQRLLRRWSGRGGAAAAERAVRLFPWPQAHAAREELVRLVLASQACGWEVHGATEWCFYDVDAVVRVRIGRRPCPLLGLAEHRRGVRAGVFLVRQAGASDLQWAHRRGCPTLLICCGDTLVGEAMGTLVARMPSGAYCPERYPVCRGSRQRVVGRHGALWHEVRFLAFHMTRAAMDSLLGAVKLYARRFNTRGTKVEWVWNPGPNAARGLARGAECFAEAVLGDDRSWLRGVVTDGMASSLQQRGVPGRRLDHVLTGVHQSVVMALHDRWRRDVELTLSKRWQWDGLSRGQLRGRRAWSRRLLSRGVHYNATKSRGSREGARRRARQRRATTEALKAGMSEWLSTAEVTQSGEASTEHMRLVAADRLHTGDEDLRRAADGWQSGSRCVPTQVTFRGWEVTHVALGSVLSGAGDVTRVTFVEMGTLLAETVLVVTEDLEHLRELRFVKCPVLDGGQLLEMQARRPELQVVVFGCTAVTTAQRQAIRRNNRRRQRRKPPRRRCDRPAEGGTATEVLVERMGARPASRRSAVRRLARNPCDGFCSAQHRAAEEKARSSLRGRVALERGDVYGLYDSESDLAGFVKAVLRQEARLDAVMQRCERAWRYGRGAQYHEGRAGARRRRHELRYVLRWERLRGWWPTFGDWWRAYHSTAAAAEAARRERADLSLSGVSVPVHIERLARVPVPGPLRDALTAEGFVRGGRTQVVLETSARRSGASPLQRGRGRRLSLRISAAQAAARVQDGAALLECDGGHTLVADEALEIGLGVQCDVCGSSVPRGKRVYKCDDCRYDICALCAAQICGTLDECGEAHGSASTAGAGSSRARRGTARRAGHGEVAATRSRRVVDAADEVSMGAAAGGRGAAAGPPNELETAEVRGALRAERTGVGSGSGQGDTAAGGGIRQVELATAGQHTEDHDTGRRQNREAENPVLRGALTSDDREPRLEVTSRQAHGVGPRHDEASPGGAARRASERAVGGSNPGLEPRATLGATER